LTAGERSQPTAQADLSAFPAGQIAKPFDGWALTGTAIQVRFNRIFHAQPLLAKARIRRTLKAPLKISFANFISRRTAELFALRESRLKAC
jgi:hypothetical protein